MNIHCQNFTTFNTILLLINYPYSELPAGKIVEFLVGFSNNGKEEFTLETLEASFRYPMDFTFYIQNFSAIAYNMEVKPTHQATLSYSFLPSEAFAGRPFGLSINLNYRDASGSSFTVTFNTIFTILTQSIVYFNIFVLQEAVYNQTISVTEVDDGLDGETFFLYVFLGAGLVLALVGGQQALASLARKRSPRSSNRQIETGTANSNVDYEWLPKELLDKISKFSSIEEFLSKFSMEIDCIYLSAQKNLPKSSGRRLRKESPKRTSKLNQWGVVPLMN